MKYLSFMSGVAFMLFIYCSNSKHKTELYEDDETITYIIPDSLLAKTTDSVRLCYKKFDNFEIWVDETNRKQLIDVIKKVDQEGLNPLTYKLTRIDSLESVRNDLKDQELLKYDVLLTETFEKLVNHFSNGFVDPSLIYCNWDIYKRPTRVSELLYESINENDIPSILKLLPNNTIYKSLKNALSELNKLEMIKFDSIKLKKKFQLKDTLTVKKIKEKLLYWGDLSNNSNINGKYDTVTRNAIKRFQTRHGLVSDGKIGYTTIKALNYNLETRKKQILTNLERWRWFPRTFGDRFMLTNLPEYMIYYVVEGDTVAQHKTCIGKPERMTPVLSSKLSNLIYYPTWTVPPTIIKEDLSVDGKKDRYYFIKQKIKIFKGKKEVNPWQWDPEKATDYKYVQDPGYENALGIVKFNFPNNHSVYMHDTNHRDYFKFDYRALSSGCVRIEKPISLSKKILEEQDDNKWETEVDSILKKKKTKIIKVKTEIFVHQLYWTSFMKGNQIHFRDDIYNMDKMLFCYFE